MYRLIPLFTIAYGAGILAFLSSPYRFALLLVGFSSISILIAVLLAGRAYFRHFSILFTVLCGFFLGGSSISYRLKPQAAKELAFLQSQKQIGIEVLLLSDPKTLLAPKEYPRPSYLSSKRFSRKKKRCKGEPEKISHPRHRYRAQLIAHYYQQKRTPLSGIIQLTIYGKRRFYKSDRMLVFGKLYANDRGRNPGAESFGLYRRLNDYVAAMNVQPHNAIVLGQPQTPSALARLRQGLLNRLSDGHPVPSPSRSILIALILGERQFVGVDLRQQFARSGLGHLLAVSGLHLSLVALFVFGLFRFVFIRIERLSARYDVKRIAALFAILATIFYLLISGMAPSAQRASMMAIAIFLSIIIGRHRDFIRPLFLSALILLIIEPLNLIRPGFVLSYASVIGIVSVLKQKRIARWIDHCHGFILLRWLKTALVVSTAAAIITMPFVALFFGRVPTWGIVANLIAVPLTAWWILPLTMVGILMSFIFPTLGELFFQLAGFGAHILIKIVEWIDRISFSSIVFQPSLAITFVLMILITLCVVKTPIYRRLLWLLIFVISVFTFGSYLKRSDLSVTMIDIGQGDSFLVRTKEGQAILVDSGGSESGFDPGKYYLLPTLNALGVDKIDLLIISHPHADHIAGSFALFDTIKINEIWICWHRGKSSFVDHMIKKAEEKKIKLSCPYQKHYQSGLRIKPIWPHLPDNPSVKHCADPALSANDNSLVIRMDYHQHSMLFTGDIEELSETIITQNLKPISFLKVPHHGSKTSSTKSFLKKLSPKTAFISAGKNNSFGLPHKRVLNRYQRFGIRVERSDQKGAVQWQCKKQGTCRVVYLWPEYLNVR